MNDLDGDELEIHRLLSAAMSSTLCHSAQLGHHSQSFFCLIGLCWPLDHAYVTT